MQLSDKQDLQRIEIGARPSLLSQAQVKEVWGLFHHQYPHMEYAVEYIRTIGDRDQATSLRNLEKTDFFTREIDEWVLQKEGRVGIHSAKDLPVPLSHGLDLFCVTRGINSSDSLVLAEGSAMEDLLPGAFIATSSVRREEMVRSLRSDLRFCDIRGTIEQRLAQLYNGCVQGVVIAEAAIIRLGLTHLTRVLLSGPTAEGQGRLAVVGRVNDHQIRRMFASIV